MEKEKVISNSRMGIIRRQAIECAICIPVLSFLAYEFWTSYDSPLVLAGMIVMYLYALGYIMFSLTVCLLVMTKKDHLLHGLQIAELDESKFSFSDRLIFVGGSGKGIVSFFTTMYSRRGMRTARIIFILYWLGILIYLWVKP